MTTVPYIDERLAAWNLSFLQVHHDAGGFRIKPKLIETEAIIGVSICLGTTLSDITDHDIEQVISQIVVDYKAIEFHRDHWTRQHQIDKERIARRDESERKSSYDLLVDTIMIECHQEAITYLDEILSEFDPAKSKQGTQVCSRCTTPVTFTDVADGYYAVCPHHDEDLYSIEVTTMAVVD